MGCVCVGGGGGGGRWGVEVSTSVSSLSSSLVVQLVLEEQRKSWEPVKSFKEFLALQTALVQQNVFSVKAKGNRHQTKLLHGGQMFN